MQSSKGCGCTISAPDPNCDYHSKKAERVILMETEMKTKPRMFDTMQFVADPESDDSSDEMPYSRYVPRELDIQRKQAIKQMKRGLMEDTSMMEKNRNSLNKFETLSIQGQTLTGISIGGFDIDLSKAAEKTMEIIPLPPSKLPVIFLDDNLNFYHHFFQGMVTLIGQQSVDFITRSEHHYDEDAEILMPLIEGMISSGYEKSDTESTLLIKKVLTSTFEPTEFRQRTETGPRLKVVANLWGFQYIECGMPMAEVDLKMWFSICHSHYRTIWFNTFKTTGVPAFAAQGVRKHRSSTSSNSTMPSLIEDSVIRDDDMRSTVSKSRRKYKSSSRSIKQSPRTEDDQRSYQVAKWLGGRT